MKKVLIPLVILGALILGSFIFISSRQEEKVSKIPQPTPEEKAEHKASFAIFTNGTYRIFTDPKYHNQSEDVYMEEANIVIVKRDGAKWSEFFSSLPMTLKKDCLITGTGQTFCTNETSRLRFFINGEEDPYVLDKKIRQGDRLLVTYGSETEGQIEEQLKQIPNP